MRAKLVCTAHPTAGGVPVGGAARTRFTPIVPVSPLDGYRGRMAAPAVISEAHRAADVLSQGRSPGDMT